MSTAAVLCKLQACSGMGQGPTCDGTVYLRAVLEFNGACFAVELLQKPVAERVQYHPYVVISTF